jgi:hypothetical protein
MYAGVRQMTEQLRKDLERRIGEKLQQWIRDSSNLYDAGGISEDAHPDIVIALLRAAISGMIAVKLTEKAAHVVVADIVKQCYER